MKKRILALALAGTTAFSVFGGLNVFAKTPDEAFSSDNYKEVTVTFSDGKFSFATDAGAVKPRPPIDAFNTDALTYDDVMDTAVENYTDTYGNIYLYDFYLSTFDSTDMDQDDITTAIGEAAEGKEWKALGTAMKKAGITAVTPDTGRGITGTLRREITSAFDDLKEDVISDPEKPTAYADNFEKADVKAYNFEGLLTAINDVDDTYSDVSSSYLVFLMQQYNTISELISPVDSTNTEDWINMYIDVLDARSEADFKAASGYKAFDAAYAEVLEDYEDATTNSKLIGIKEDLEDLVMGYTVGRKSSLATSAGVDKGELKATIDMAEDYFKSTDYGFNKKNPEKSSDEYKYFEDIFEDANELYKRSKSYSYQSTVDAYVDLLTEAIDALDPDSDLSDWRLLRLENAVEEASGLVETDYTTSSWKTLSSALTAAENGLASSNLSNNRATSLASDLEKAVKGLNAKSVPAATRNALKDAINDAKDMMEEMTDSASGNQLLGLSTAINDADDLWKTKYTTLKNDTLISEVEAATAALNDAMTLAQHPQGWYQDDKGTWFYGVGTENYTGWLELNGRTYFLKDDGSMAASTWVKTEAGYWYYLNASGAMLHDGWAKINDTWYFFKNFGGMAEGWVKDGNTWYYLTPGSGKMVTGWNLINGKYYYFDASGAMLANTTTPDGYKVDASGAWVK